VTPELLFTVLLPGSSYHLSHVLGRVQLLYENWVLFTVSVSGAGYSTMLGS
jgi:hypothetical protein